MLTLPTEIIPIITAFAPLFTQPTFRKAQVLLVGAILAPRKRTVTAALRVMGLAHEKCFSKYHRFLNRDKWHIRKAARILLRLLVHTFVPTGTVMLVIDDTLERRRGPKIKAKGIYRDAVRSSKQFFVKASGLRWIVMALLVEIPWAKQVWALPFFIVLAPSKRYDEELKRPHRTLADWARQMICQVRRWLPDRDLLVVADSAYATLDLLAACQKMKKPVTVITRLRLDAGLYEPAPQQRKPGQRGPNPKKGKRQPTLEAVLADPGTDWSMLTVANWYQQGLREVAFTNGASVWYHQGKPVVPLRWVLLCDPADQFEPQALLCTRPDLDAGQILSCFLQRWQVEVTFEESRAHLGIETQRQWHDLAIERTTPVLFSLFSLVTLIAHQWLAQGSSPVRQAAWYSKEQPTFADAMALVRHKLWPCAIYSTSSQNNDSDSFLEALADRLMETLCYAA